MGDGGCVGCDGPLRKVLGHGFLTCDTEGCGGNVSRFDTPAARETGPQGPEGGAR